jgi:transposase
MTEDAKAQKIYEMILRLRAIGASVRGIAGVFGVSKSTMGRWLANVDAAVAAERLSQMGQRGGREPQEAYAPTGESVPNGTGGAA